jgi:8-oxo-dGTP pyrophosphatase MutT (NUDIX family)
MTIDLQQLDRDGLRALILTRLLGTGPSVPGDERILSNTARDSRRFRHLLPAQLQSAAVLVPIVDRPSGLAVLLTERASSMRRHGGQVSFPGGRVEDADADVVAAALRETEEEIGLDRSQVEVLGFLPDHIVYTGFRVTPVVALVRPELSLTLDAGEVASVFEVPLSFIFDPRNRRQKPSGLGDKQLLLHEMWWDGYRVWGATAGMLLTFERLLAQGPDPVEASAYG